MVAWEYALKDGTVYVIGHSVPLQYVRDRYGNVTTLTWSATNTFDDGYGKRLTTVQGVATSGKSEARSERRSTSASETDDRPQDEPEPTPDPQQQEQRSFVSRIRKFVLRFRSSSQFQYSTALRVWCRSFLPLSREALT